MPLSGYRTFFITIKAIIFLFPCPMASQVLHDRTGVDEPSCLLSLQWQVLVQKRFRMLHGAPCAAQAYHFSSCCCTKSVKEKNTFKK